MSPDPHAGSADISNPQSLNRYSYVLNGTLGYVDPTGLECVLFTGINTNKGTKDTQAAQFGIDRVVYTYPDGTRASGVASVISQALNGPNTNTIALANGISALPTDQANTALIVSGSGQALSTANAWGLLGQAQLQSIQSYIYLSPGSMLFSNLPGGSSRSKFHGNGAIDDAVTLLSRLHGGHGTGTPCAHGDLACQLRNLPESAFNTATEGRAAR